MLATLNHRLEKVYVVAGDDAEDMYVTNVVMAQSIYGIKNVDDEHLDNMNALIRGYCSFLDDTKTIFETGKVYDKDTVKCESELLPRLVSIDLAIAVLSRNRNYNKAAKKAAEQSAQNQAAAAHTTTIGSEEEDEEAEIDALSDATDWVMRREYFAFMDAMTRGSLSDSPVYDLIRSKVFAAMNIRDVTIRGTDEASRLLLEDTSIFVTHLQKHLASCTKDVKGILERGVKKLFRYEEPVVHEVLVKKKKKRTM